MPEHDVSGGKPSTAPRGSEPSGPEPSGAELSDPRALPARRPRPGRRRRKAVLFALAAVVIAAGAVWALLGSSLFVVRSVTVTGAGAVPRAEVLRAAGIKPGTPLARVDTAAAARRVEQLTQVQSAQVSRNWPD